VLIAGPSSAGKTTSCRRLAIHLRVVGLRPVQLSTDDYFVAEKDDPIGPDGKPDYEDIRAVDVAGLRKDLAALIAGRPVKRRVFDFRAKAPTWTDESLRLGPDDVVLIEGIHALNPILSEGIPKEQTFKIYLSALTQLGIDDDTILSTSDNRLVRRLVRDHLFRGHDAKRTLSMWPSVRRGEEKWIFPFQGEADVSFNTSLDYELSVLRPFAEALLAEIKPGDAEYPLARRLQAVLRNFHPIPATAVPGDSILREYIGGSTLRY
jgi:uridine kinase